MQTAFLLRLQRGTHECLLDEGSLRIDRALVFVADGFQRTEPKSKRGRRTVDLPAFAIAALREHRKCMPAEGWEQNRRNLVWLRLFHGKPPQGFEPGLPLYESSSRYIHYRLLTSKGVCPVRA
jgi:hypothetical protein